MIGLRLLAVLALVGVNAFFAAAEFSLVAVRVSRVRQLVEKGVPSARAVQQLLGQLDRVVSGVQVGITLTSLGLGALGESTFAQIFRPMLGWLPGSRAAILAHSLALALAFGLLTFLHVVIGELVPKTISLEHAARASLIIARPFLWYLNTFRWVIAALDGASRRVLSALGVTSHAAGHTMVHSTEELEVQIHQARERGLLAPGEERFMLSVMDLGQLQAREIMVPRPDVQALPVEANLDEVLAYFATTQRSRLPVYDSTLDHVLGFVHTKDILWILTERKRRAEDKQPVLPFDLRRVLREVLIVPESKQAGELLAEMRVRRTSMAMVVDEFGSILGLLTLEDILEQLVGEIHDEFDMVEAPQVVGAGSESATIFDGSASLRDLETQHNIVLPEDPAYATLGGFVLAQLGIIPKGGESFEYGGYRFTVMEMDRRRVARVKLQWLAPAISSATAAQQGAGTSAPPPSTNGAASTEKQRTKVE
jgi:putative hemolysin